MFKMAVDSWSIVDEFKKRPSQIKTKVNLEENRLKICMLYARSVETLRDDPSMCALHTGWFWMGVEERMIWKMTLIIKAKCPQEKGSNEVCRGVIWKFVHFVIYNTEVLPAAMTGRNCWAGSYSLAQHLPIISYHLGKNGTERMEICSLRLGADRKTDCIFLKRFLGNNWVGSDIGKGLRHSPPPPCTR